MSLQTKGYTPTRKQSSTQPRARSVAGYIAVAVLALLLHATGTDGIVLHAQPSDILYIGDLNGDCQSDTVRSKRYGGAEGESASELPSRIHWGIVPPGAADGKPSPCTGATVHAGGAVSVPVTHVVCHLYTPITSSLYRSIL